MKSLYPFLVLTLSLSTPCAEAQAPSVSIIETVAGREPVRISGLEFSISGVSGLATDSGGNIYFSIQARSQVFRLGVDGQVSVFAGNGVQEKYIEGSRAASSPVPGPRSVAVDSADNVYIVCDGALVKVDAATGVLSTVFTVPYKQPGTSDFIGDILEMVVGHDGNLYFSDGRDARVKAYSFASGGVTVVAGDGTIGPTQTSVAATSTPLRYPEAVAVGSDGTIYFSTLEPAVYRVSPEDRKLQALNIALPEEKGPLGEYDIPSSIALDGRGHLFVAQANRSRILRLDLKDGIAEVYAGTGQQGFNGDRIPANQAMVTALRCVVDPTGNLILSEFHRIRSVSSSTQVISTRAGSGNAIVDDEHTLAMHARLREPANAVAAPDGSLYITSSFGNRLMRLEPNGELASAAGGGSFVRMDTKGGLAAQVALNNPQGIWVDTNNDVFFSDDDNRIVRHFAPDAEVITNFAVTLKNFHSAGLYLYYAGALVSDGNHFFLSDPNGGCVWRISRQDGTVELFVGEAPGNHGPSNDTGQLSAPSGLAVDSTGNLYISDGRLGRKDGRILRVNGATRQITTILSDLRQPSGLAFQSPDILCFSESGGHQVRCLSLKSHSLRVLAGTGVGGFSGDDGPAECAQLNRPSGISFDQAGNLYIADTGNQRIRRVRPGLRQARCSHQ